MKKRITDFLLKYNIIHLVIDVIAFIITVTVLCNISQSELVFNFFDVSILSSFIIVALIDGISQAIERYIKNKNEDKNKATTNYKSLISKYVYKEDSDLSEDEEATGQYMPRLITYKNSNGKKIVLPEIIECNLYGKEIEIADSNKEYQLPELVCNNITDIMQAHKSSNVYNQTNIRIDNWYFDKDKNKFVINTSRTSYYKSLVTNRAMDYKWKDGLTVREAFQYGPFFKRLSESKLSNHIGFNCLLETSDNMIVFVKRGKHLSVGKGEYCLAVSASLKARYALRDGKLTVDGIKNAVYREIKDESRLDIGIENINLKENLIAAYRDMVEGGKPQFVFYLYLKDVTKSDFVKNFSKDTKKIRDKKNATKVDGFKLFWLPKSELSDVTIETDGIIYKKKKYRMSPSTIASIVTVLNHLNENGDINENN